MYIHTVYSPSFVWDPAKSERTLRERGFDFAFASRIFDGPVLVRRAREGELEERWLAVGEVDGRELTVVFTWVDDCCRIISARRSRVEERQAYRRAGP